MIGKDTEKKILYLYCLKISFYSSLYKQKLSFILKWIEQKLNQFPGELLQHKIAIKQFSLNVQKQRIILFLPTSFP